MGPDACVILNNGLAEATRSEEINVLIDDFTKEADIVGILAMKRIAVVGLSDQPDRPSYDVARYLQAHGFTIIPVNPNATEVLGEKAYPDLSSLPEPPEVVEIFRR